MGASSSRNPLLLRNTFNIEIYNQFVQQKRELRNKFKQEYKQRQDEVMKFINSQSEHTKDANWRFVRRIRKINDMANSSVKRNHLLKMLTEEVESAGKIDLSFFKAMEMNLDTEHQAQVNAAMEQFTAKATIAKKSE